jgi:hypothetical protein
LAKRDVGGGGGGGGGVRAFDDLARGLDSGEISRAKAMKLGGAALVASALGLFASQRAEAQEIEPTISKKKCKKQKNGTFCKSNKADCKKCCKKGSNRPNACCGSKECNCCKKNEGCNNKGKCT